MRRTLSTAVLLLTLTVVARSLLGAQEAGSYSASRTPPLSTNANAVASGAMPGPEWFQVNHKARTVIMRVAAAQDASHLSWNFNGYMNGSGTITVPQGYKITIIFSNQDYWRHSIGVATRWATEPPALPDAAPAFPGAISSKPTSHEDATGEGAWETITFTASKAGEYVLMCFVPSYATAGMWVNFNVVAGQEAGVRDGI